MKIGDEVYIHGYIDEIRQDTVIIRNDGGYFGTVPSEVVEQEPNEDLISRQDAINVIEKCKAELTRPGYGLVYAKLKRLINECPNGE